MEYEAAVETVREIFEELGASDVDNLDVYANPTIDPNLKPGQPHIVDRYFARADIQQGCDLYLVLALASDGGVDVSLMLRTHRKSFDPPERTYRFLPGTFSVETVLAFIQRDIDWTLWAYNHR